MFARHGETAAVETWSFEYDVFKGPQGLLFNPLFHSEGYSNRLQHGVVLAQPEFCPPFAHQEIP